MQRAGHGQLTIQLIFEQTNLQAYLGMRSPHPSEQAEELSLPQLRCIGCPVGATRQRSPGARRACSRSVVGAAIARHTTHGSCLCCGTLSSAAPEQVELVAAAVVAAGAVERLFRLVSALHRLRAPLQVLLETRERDSTAEQSRR